MFKQITSGQLASALCCVSLCCAAIAITVGNRAVRGAAPAAAGDATGMSQVENAGGGRKAAFLIAGIRYQVADVDRAVAFYTGKLGFKLEQQSGPAFARVSNGGLALWLSGPGSSGSRPMPDGRRQEPGGWNRLVLQVEDLPAVVTRMRQAHMSFRNQIETGPGGRQIQLEDPDGNPVELFEPASRP